MRLRVLLALTVSLAASVVAADEDRERKARVALALSAHKPVTSIAPAPRPAPKPYDAGYKASTVEQLPLVVFVNCPSWEVPGAIVAKASAPFAGVDGPAVVVGFPQGEKLYIDATVACDPVKVSAAVRAAQKKIDLPPATSMPAAPRPLSWNL